MNKGISRKERIAKWWKIEGKIECTGAFILLVVLGVFWGNLLVEGVLGILVAIWCLGKIYFRRDQWAFLALAALWTSYQGIHALLAYIR